MNEILTLTHATERDVDLLIVEELRCSPDFVKYVLDIVRSRVGKSIAYGDSRVLHSTRRTFNRREIDICLTVAQPALSPAYVLIENKLDSDDQPGQAASYREESELLLSSGRASATALLLLCPQDYAVRNAGFAHQFDAVLTYEEVVVFLEKRAQTDQSELSARLSYRGTLLRQAIEKWRRGYEAVPLPAIAAFNRQYIALCAEHAPLLKPGKSMTADGRPGESKTMIFHPDTLPNWPCLPQTRIVHQLREGNANICFYGWGDSFADLVGMAVTDLKGTPYRPIPTVNKRKNGRSGLMIVAKTPSIDNTLGFEAQRVALREGIAVTAELRDWVWKNRAVVERWAAIAGAKVGN